MKVGFLFAGQGSQYVGMGQDFYQKMKLARHVYNSIHLDFDLKRVCFQGPEEALNDTAYTQCAILATSLAIAACVSDLGIQPDYVAGLSLGEYSALTYAGALSLDDSLTVVRQRGLIMAEALKGKNSRMMAVLDKDIETIQAVCDSVSQGEDFCVIANYNSPNQVVLSATQPALEKDRELLKKHGIRRMIPLSVAGAFHSPLMIPASEKLADVLKDVPLQPCRIPVIFNVTGQIETTEIKELLIRQIKSSVRFAQSIQTMLDKGVDTFIEIGPGHALSKFVKATDKNVKIFSINTFEDFLALKEEWKHE